MRSRPLLAGLALVLLLGACSDDGGNEAEPLPTTTLPAVTAAPGTTVAGPTGGDAACIDLAERYVRRARVLFAAEGTPNDALVDRVRGRLEEFDQIAGAAGCGPEYVTGVCAGLDALTQEGLLVIIPLTTAQCL